MNKFAMMSLNPLDIALREISETKRLLDTLIVSSETFDYQKAKLALKALESKKRDLAKLKTTFEIQQQQAHAPANVIPLRLH